MKDFLPFISINGEIFPKEKASISILNSGLLYGEAFFTTLKVAQKIPLFLELHYQRLLETSLKFKYKKIISFVELKIFILKLIKKNLITNCSLRITFTKIEEEPIFFIFSKIILEKDDPVDLVTIKDARDSYRNFKTINRLENKSSNLVFVQNKKIIEASNANIVNLKNNTFITPKIINNGLRGIVRQLLVDNNVLKIGSISEDTSLPLVLINSLRIIPVKSIDKRILRQDKKHYFYLKESISELELNYIKNNQ